MAGNLGQGPPAVKRAGFPACGISFTIRRQPVVNMSEQTLSDTPRSYREAGVDVAAGEAFVERIKPLVARTKRPEVLGGLGGFGGLFRLDPDAYTEPVLVAGTDGVGTKLRLAVTADRHRGVGIDLVAMCVNDLIVCGAEPLFFLDYLATGQLDADRLTEVMAGVADGCAEAGAALLGGETAEMPGMYAESDYDLAGFAVGVVERNGLIDGSRATAGDGLIGLPASGPHSNGFSLIRRLLEARGTRLAETVGDTDLGSALLAPTRIYVAAVRALQNAVDVRALAHITGGGIPGNLPRTLPDGVGARLDPTSWPRPPVLEWIREAGDLPDEEMRATFNDGLGMIAAVPTDQVDAALAALAEAGEPAHHVGELVRDPDGEVHFADA